MIEQLKSDLEKEIVESLVKTIVVFSIRNNIDLGSEQFHGFLSSVDISNVDLSDTQIIKNILSEII